MNSMAEFKITSDLSALRGAVIEANFEEVRAWLDENLAPYREMAVIPETIPQAKTYRANIRKVKDRIDQSRKEAKNAALAAYTEFESKCKELTGLCDEATNAIDSQIKSFEAAEKQEKCDLLKAEYQSYADAEAREYCPWDSIFDPRWLNKGYNIEEAKEEIRAKLYNTAVNIESIRTMGGEDTAYLLDVFKTTHDINAVIRKQLALKAAREREEERRKQMDQAKKAEPAPAPAPAPKVEEQDPPTTEIVTVDFRVTCTREKLAALGQYMRTMGIEYGRVI